MRIDWEYKTRGRYLNWQYDRCRMSGQVESCLPSGTFSHPFHIEPLKPAKGLAEAMFFG
jgi:hypothetical protein